MKHLFVARHGDYDGDYRISNYGRQQMETLGKAIKQVLNGSSAYLVSSTAPRALDSSEILAVELGLPLEFERTPYIWSGNSAPEDSHYKRFDSNDKLVEFVNERKDKADGLIMVTHLEITDWFPYYFLKKELEIDNPINIPDELPKGMAVHIDIGQRGCKIIP
jgi:broad specificity phosphatase PhoE